MNGKELQALRKLLMLDVSEAADLVGEVSSRSWQYWETGRSSVPDDVAEKMEELLEQRNQLLSEKEAELFEKKGAEIRFYLYFDEFAADHPEATRLGWRLSQGVAASLFADRFARLS